MINWTEVAATVLSTTGIVTVLGLVAKAIFEKYLASKLEEQKSKLEKERIEHQVRYSKLYEERGKVVQDMYETVINVENILISFIDDSSGVVTKVDESRLSDVIEHLRATEKKIENKRLFFPEHICEMLYNVVNQGLKVFVNYHKFKSNEQEILSKTHITAGEEWVDFILKQKSSTLIFKNDLIKARLELAKEFRTLIGVS